MEVAASRGTTVMTTGRRALSQGKSPAKRDKRATVASCENGDRIAPYGMHRGASACRKFTAGSQGAIVVG